MAARLAQETYRQQYGARIDPSPDSFIVLTEGSGPGETGSPTGAVAGLTFARDSQLLSEHYLAGAAEEVLARHLDEQLDRSEIVEVGALASTTRGAGLHLVSLLPMLCWCNGAKAAICTVTHKLSLMLPRVNVAFVPLCRANESDLPAHLAGRWGSYYAAQPVTGYVDFRPFAQTLIAASPADAPALAAGV